MRLKLSLTLDIRRSHREKDEPVETQADLSGTSGGQYEKAEPYGDPDTSVPGNGVDPDARGPRIGFRRNGERS